MKTDNVSEPIFSNSNGWFRYNYDQSRLEFLNYATRQIVSIWEIPVDQWDSLASKQQYCENIVSAEFRLYTSQQQEKRKYQLIFKISAVITAILSSIDLYLYINGEINWNVLIINFIAFSIASGSYYKSKEI